MLFHEFDYGGFECNRIDMTGLQDMAESFTAIAPYVGLDDFDEYQELIASMAHTAE